jgi:phenylalanyl-tRNA synthetase beta chain
MFGLELTDNEIESLLLPLGLELKAEGAGQWQVDVPSHRFDISIEEDLIEEAGRLYNYDRLPVRYPAARLAPQKKPEARAELPLLRRLLVARGYQEAVTYSFIDEDSYVLFNQQSPLKLANPISADLSCMRSSLLPGLLKALEHNLNRQQTRVRLFESGLRFVGQLDNLKQEPMLAGVITGLRLPEGWANGKDKVDFYDLKADVEAVLAAAGSLDAFSFKPAQKDGFHPGQCAAIERDGEVIGHLGTLHPQTAAAMDIDQQVFMFELELEAATAGRLPQFSELSKFPEVRRDFALVVKTDTPAADIVGCMRKQAGEWLNEVRLFDVYQGQGVEPGCKSMALGLTWQHPSRTLTDEEVNSAVEQMLQSLNDEFGATLRK